MGDYRPCHYEWNDFMEGVHGLNGVFADTREELLTHAIEQQKEIIQKAEAEIARMDAMREVAGPTWTPQQTWIGGEGGDH